MNSSENSSVDARARTLLALSVQYQDLKLTHSFLARSWQQDKALDASKQMVIIASEMCQIKPTSVNRKNVEYAKYVEAVDACLVAQFSADFDGAEKFADDALRAAQHFRKSKQFFPNFFFDEADIASRGQYLRAVKLFRDGQFGLAASHFQKWLSLNQHRRGKGDARYDSNEFHQQLCVVLDAIDRGVQCASQWGDLERALESRHRNIHKTSRALWDHLAPLKTAARFGINEFPGGRPQVDVLLTIARSDWQLLSTAAPIAVKDRAAGLDEPVRLAEFLDVFHCLHQVGDCWRYFLLQSFRNALVLKADYESRLRLGTNSRDSTPSVKATFEIEQLTDSALVDYTRELVAARDITDLETYIASTPLWFEARHAVRHADRADAEEKCRHFYARLRSFPHVIRAKTSRVVGEIGHFNQGGPSVHYELVAERIWRHAPVELTLETTKSLPARTYAYLRPRWNRSSKPRSRIRHQLDLPLAARLPEWMVLFERWASGRGPVDGTVFLRWCHQIEPRWRATALRLLSQLIFLEESDIRELWKNLYRSRLPASLKGPRTLYVGLGRAAKSGPFQLYWLKQALNELPESERSFDFRTAFRNEDGLRDEVRGIDSVVFVDDFIGTGEQGTDFIDSVLRRYSWLEQCSIFFCALAGFEDSISRVEEALVDFNVRVLVAKTLAAKDRAFAEQNPLWDSDIDRECARVWCQELGVLLLQGEFDDPISHALGWRGSEALIAFHSNTPDNTLPLFWAKGTVNGKDWHPLLPRF